VSIEITNGATSAAYVQHGLGVALLPDFVAPSSKNFARLPVTDADLRWSFALATPETRRGSAAARALLKLVEQRLTGLPSENAGSSPESL
jgi:DNA-binding transcriptional LysR family regulator